MSLDFLEKEHRERIIEWVTGGRYAVAVEVEAIIYPDRLDAPYLTPQTVRYLEEVTKLAEAGDLEGLQKAGTVYIRLDELSNPMCPREE